MSPHNHSTPGLTRPPRAGILAAGLAAVLFGLSAPAAKWLLGRVEPLPLAGLLYLGSGLGLLLAVADRALLGAWMRHPAALARPDGGPAAVSSSEAPLARADLPWLAGAVVCGGIAAPILMMWGLSLTTGSAGSLLLNLEGILTALLAGLLFHEAVGGRTWTAAVLMAGAGVLLSLGPQTAGGSSQAATHGILGLLPLGPLLVVGACALWGLDNNLTRHLSGKDPLVIAIIKGLTAGSVTLALAHWAGAHLPPWQTLLVIMVLGSLSYGVSLVLFIRALRHLGAARTGAVFGLAPFVGAAAAVAFLGEAATLALAGATLLMAAGAWLIIGEAHAHEHSHTELSHDHRHSHDEHHGRHDHPETLPEHLPRQHSHPHVHTPLVHSHPHLPDLHHRHRHKS